MSGIDTGIFLTEELARDTAKRFGYLAIHSTEGGWCVHVFRDHQIGCKAVSLLDGLLHVNEVHVPGELDPELHEIEREDD